MKSTELYRHLRGGLGDWFRSSGFRRAPKAQCGCRNNQDVSLRYFDAQDVDTWASFLRSILPGVLRRPS